MKFSLINVSIQKEGKVNGYWTKDANGVSLEEAIERAKSIEKANSNKIDIAVVPQLNSTTPAIEFWTDLERLDQRRNISIRLTDES